MADPLDKEGDWEIRVSIYRNGRRVAFTDALGDSYDFASDTIRTALELREVTVKVPR